MQIEDLRRLDQGREIRADICIVGSGPAGLTIAREFFGTAVDVLVVESGGLAEESEVDALSEIESVGAPRRMEPTLTRNRIFGGSSHSWSGRCAAFDDIDFEARAWVPFSGWPIRRAALDSYLDRAAAHLGVGPNCYDHRVWPLLGRSQPQPDVNTELLRPFFWQFSRDELDLLDFMRFGRRFLSSTASNIRILLHATATQVTTNDTGSQVTSLEVTNLEDKRATVRAKALVLCAGGIENARLLLCSKRVVKEGVGNKNDVVGRFLMDHPRCTLAEFDVEHARRIQDRFGLYQDKQGGHFLHGLALSAQFQKKMGLLNCAAWLTEDRAADDPWDAAKRLMSGRDRHVVRDAWSVLSQPRLVFLGSYDRLVRRRGVRHKLRRLPVDCMVEQRPDPESRIRLSDRQDKLGMPLPQLDWRISEQEKTTVAAFGRLIVDEFKRIGLPAPILTEWVQSGRTDQARFVDVAHPAGTTRMARDPRQGVVDENCQVHGVDGLFIAGSSVFPTSGHANPTLMIVALAIRLADWLKTRQFR